MFERRLEKHKSSSPGLFSGTAEGRASTVDDTEGMFSYYRRSPTKSLMCLRSAIIASFVKRWKVLETRPRLKVPSGAVEATGGIHASREG